MQFFTPPHFSPLYFRLSRCIDIFVDYEMIAIWNGAITLVYSICLHVFACVFCTICVKCKINSLLWSSTYDKGAWNTHKKEIYIWEITLLCNTCLIFTNIFNYLTNINIRQPYFLTYSHKKTDMCRKAIYFLMAQFPNCLECRGSDYVWDFFDSRQASWHWRCHKRGVL